MIHDFKTIRAHTILFTEDCPLNCRYCELQRNEDYRTCPGQTFEEVHAKVDQYIKQDTEEGFYPQITFTGGEPFLYWNWIKMIIDEYQHQAAYHFNTSGYLFTEDMLEFLSHYDTFFTLSIDGGEKLTNYLRPVRGTITHTGYFNKIKEIAPALIYYFPTVVAKLIVNNRYVDLMYQTYLDIEQLGFRAVTFILDFNSRPSYEGTKKQQQRLWDDNDTQILQEQMSLITKEILYGFAYNKSRMQVTNLNGIISFLLKEKNEDYSPDNLVCNVFNGRTLETLTNSQERHCFQGHFNTLEEAKQGLINEFEKTKGKCPIDNDCPAFLYCANTNCPISSMTATKTWFGSDSLECILAKTSYFAAVDLLKAANDICPTSPSYLLFLNGFDFKGREEVVKDGTNQLLSML